MKLKFRFPGMLWPFRKLCYIRDVNHELPPKRPWIDRWAVGLLFLWTLVWMMGGCPKTHAQSLNKIDTGKQVPDVTMNILNRDILSPVSLSSYKGKLVIIDFWATWCTACLYNFPKMESLQKEFGDKIAVLPVTYQPKALVQKFLASPAGKVYHISSVVGDTVLRKLFAHRGIPHCVWIDSTGKVIAITGADEVTSANIKARLESSVKPMIEKVDIRDDQHIFLADRFPFKDSLLNYSIFYKGSYSGLGNGMLLRKTGNVVTGRAYTNEVLFNMFYGLGLDLFQTRYKELLDPKQIIVEVKDTTGLKLNFGEDGIGRIGNQYTFEMNVPLSQADSLTTFMLRDINKYSPYQANAEQRELNCLVLVRTSKQIKFATKGGKRENSLFYNNPARVINGPIDWLVFGLNEVPQLPFLVLDETGYTGNIDIQITSPVRLKNLRRELKRYDLDLVEAKRLVNVLVIRDNASLRTTADKPKP